MERNTLQFLRQRIEDEMTGLSIYQAVADMAPKEEHAHLLRTIAQEEQTHIDALQQIYHRTTGRLYLPQISAPQLEPEAFWDVLRQLVLDEAEDYRIYADQYYQNRGNPALREICYRAMVDENLHALQLLYLLSE